MNSEMVYLGLGANLGDRLVNLRHAGDALAAHRRIVVSAISSVYESAAMTLRPDDSAPDYLNVVISVETFLSPVGLLEHIHKVERSLGRQRSPGLRWESRTIDIDILVFGTRTVSIPGLTIPHPALAKRRFVIEPLAELAPDLYVPLPFDASAADLASACDGAPAVRRISEGLSPAVAHART